MTKYITNNQNKTFIPFKEPTEKIICHKYQGQLTEAGVDGKRTEAVTQLTNHLRLYFKSFKILYVHVLMLQTYATERLLQTPTHVRRYASESTKDIAY